MLQSVDLTEPLDLDETLVYASVKPSEVKLKGWLQNFVDRQPSVRVKIRERKTRSGGIWCNVCKVKVDACPHCATAFERAPEKGIDAAIVTDLLSLAWEGAFDVAVLVTSDADFIPAVEKVQERGLKVVNALIEATWMPPLPRRACPRHGTLSRGPCPRCQQAQRRAKDAKQAQLPWTYVYRTQAWRAARQDQLSRYPSCELCGAAANTVDHVPPLRERWDGEGFTLDPYDPDTLRSLCASCSGRLTAGFRR